MYFTNAFCRYKRLFVTCVFFAETHQFAIFFVFHLIIPCERLPALPPDITGLHQLYLSFPYTARHHCTILLRFNLLAHLSRSYSLNVTCFSNFVLGIGSQQFAIRNFSKCQNAFFEFYSAIERFSYFLQIFMKKCVVFKQFTKTENCPLCQCITFGLSNVR